MYEEMEVQKFLRKGHSLEELKSQLGIKYVEHPDGLNFVYLPSFTITR